MISVIDDQVSGNVVPMCKHGFVSQVVSMGKVIVNRVTIFDEGGVTPIWAFRFYESQNAVYYPIFF